MTKEQIKQIVKLTESLVDKKLNESGEINLTKLNAFRWTIAPIVQHGERILKEIKQGETTSESIEFFVDAIEERLPQIKKMLKQIMWQPKGINK